MYNDLIVIHLFMVYAHGLHYKHHTRMIINTFHLNEYKCDTWKCDWVIGNIISINICMITNDMKVPYESSYTPYLLRHMVYLATQGASNSTR